jgi:hypothetical protein
MLGKPDAVKGIELNGYPVNIRENLWSALVNLRDATEEEFYGSMRYASIKRI